MGHATFVVHDDDIWLADRTSIHARCSRRGRFHRGYRSWESARRGRYLHGFAWYGLTLGPSDGAMLPIGAYEPPWFMKYQHTDPAEADRAASPRSGTHLRPSLAKPDGAP